MQFGIDEDRIEADLQYTRQFSPRLRTVTGAGYHRESIEAPFYFDTDNRLNIYRVLATGLERGNLDPEINRSYELGYLWHPTRALRFDARLYYEDLSDLIVAFFRPETELVTVNPGNFVLDFDNEEDVTIRGFEAQFDWQGDHGSRVYASYGLTDIDADGARYDNGYEDSAPSHTFALLASRDFGSGWQASVNYDYQSKMIWYFDEPIGDYHKLDMRIAKTFDFGETRAVTELIGTNLLARDRHAAGGGELGGRGDREGQRRARDGAYEGARRARGRLG